MKRRCLHSLTILALALLMAATIGAAPSSAAPLGDDVTMTIDPSLSSVILGENLDLAVTVVNTGTVATPPLVVHIDITSPDRSTSVDPEDWTPTLSKTVGSVDPGMSVVVDWTIQPISGGTFATYAIALSPGVDTIAASNVLEVRVADKRSLNPGGILPVALAAPGIIGALLVAQMWYARRPRQPALT